VKLRKGELHEKRDRQSTGLLIANKESRKMGVTENDVKLPITIQYKSGISPNN